MRTIGRDFGDTARKVYAVASGALGNGKTCVVNSNGTVSVVAGNDQAVGSAVVFESAQSRDFRGVFDSNANKIVIAYKDTGNSSRGTAIVGTVDPSDNSISFGSAVVFETGAVNEYVGAAFDSNSNKVVIGFGDSGDSSKGKAIVGTVSGTSISFGTAAVFDSGETNSISVTFDSNLNKVVISYVDASNSSRGTAIVGTVSNTDISFGSKANFNTNQVSSITSTFDSNSNKVVIAYRNDAAAARGTAVVGTVSGTSITFGTAVQFNAAVTNFVTTTFDSNSNKVVISYRDNGNSSYGTAIVGTVSNTAISFGTEVVFYSAAIEEPYITFDSSSNKVAIAYADTSSDGNVIAGTVSGTSITFETALVYESQRAGDISAMYDSNSNRVVIFYSNPDNSSYGTSRVFQNASTNITSENYIGITPSAYPDGAGAEIQTKGAVNEEQSGLTAGQSYFVQTDGTLSTTAGDPSVFAGTAVSATKIIVKG